MGISRTILHRKTPAGIRCRGKRGGCMEMTELRYMVLKLYQIYDVIRSASVARLAVTDGTRPYVTPMRFQWELDGQTSIFHFACTAHGRRFDCLTEYPHAMVEIERRTADGTEVVLAEGAAVMLFSPEDDAALVQVIAERVTGRRYFHG